VIDDTLTDEMRITVIATGFDKEVVSVASACSDTRDAVGTTALCVPTAG
jgi:cell division GTPase FtsZ